VDEEVRKVWGAIYDGNSDDPEALVKRFKQKYGKYLHRRPTYPIGPIDKQRVWRRCATGKHTAGGLDGWEPCDLAIISRNASDLLVDMLMEIEMGANWPSCTYHSRVVFLAKDPNKLDNALEFRLLTIMSSIYRKWGAERHEDMEGWANDWCLPGMYTMGLGADAAWWHSAVELELAQLQDKTIVGGSLDIKKAFDQLQRPLLKSLLIEAGFPPRLLGPYFRYLDSLVVYNSIGGDLGHGYHRKCGIPQGCPMSMMMMSFMLVPWLKMIDLEYGMPRI
jgi:hypothetical protein